MRSKRSPATVGPLGASITGPPTANGEIPKDADAWPSKALPWWRRAPISVSRWLGWVTTSTWAWKNSCTSVTSSRVDAVETQRLRTSSAWGAGAPCSSTRISSSSTPNCLTLEPSLPSAARGRWVVPRTRASASVRQRPRRPRPRCAPVRDQFPLTSSAFPRCARWSGNDHTPSDEAVAGITPGSLGVSW